MSSKTRKMCWIILFVVTIVLGYVCLSEKVMAAQSKESFHAIDYKSDDAFDGKTGTGIEYVGADAEHDYLVGIPLEKVESGTYEVWIEYSFAGEMGTDDTYINVVIGNNDDNWKKLDPTDLDYDVFKAQSLGIYELSKDDKLAIQRGGNWCWISEVELIPVYQFAAVDYVDEENSDAYVENDYVKSDVDKDQKLVSIPLSGIASGQYEVTIEYSRAAGEETGIFSNLTINKGKDNWKQVPATAGEGEYGVFNTYTFINDNGETELYNLDKDDTLHIWRGNEWIWYKTITLTMVEGVPETDTFGWNAVGKQLRKNDDDTKDIRFIFSLPEDSDYKVLEVGTVAARKGKNPGKEVEENEEIAISSGSGVVVTKAKNFYSEITAEGTTYKEDGRYLTTLRLTGVSDTKTYCCRAYAKVKEGNKVYVIYSDTIEASVSDFGN